MAILVAVAGGLIGSLFGVPQLGFLVGSLLGSFLFQPSGPKNVGKVNDVRVTASTYGSPITRGYGTARIGGNIIWGNALKEHKHHQGKGGGGTSYTYSWTGGVGICEGPVADVTRIWADSKIVFDKTGQTSGKTLNRYKLKFRLYKGTETQLPDPALEAKVGASNATAHRGLAYIVFDNIPVQDYGNRVPNWTFEVAFNTTSDTQTAHAITFTSALGTPSSDNVVVDWDRDRAFFITDGSGSTAGIQTCDLNSGAVENFATVAQIGADVQAKAACMGLDGYLYVTNYGASNQESIHKIDPESLTVVGSFGPSVSIFPDYNDDGFPPSGLMVPLQVGGTNYVFCSARGTILGTDVGVFNADTMSVSPSASSFTAPGSGSTVAVCPGSQIDDTTGTVFGIEAPTFPGTTLTFLRWDVAFPGNVTRTEIATLAPTDILASWANFNNVDGLVYDVSDGNVILGVSTTSTVSSGESQSYIIKLNVATGAVMWKAPVNAIQNDSQGMPKTAISNGVYSFVGATAASYSGAGDASAAGYRAVYNIVTQDGSYTRQEWPITTEATPQVWNGDASALLFHGSMTGIGSSKWIVIYTDRAAGGAVGVGDVVSDICSRAGLDSGDIDVTELTDTVEGYIISNQQTAKDSIAPLALAFMFDGVESDDKIKFIKRGGDSVATIPSTDLAIMDPKTNATSQETRTQEVDLSSQVSLQFLDPHHDYQQATQYMRRTFSPVKTMYSQNVNTIGLPIVMEPLFAKQLCEQILYTQWIERTAYKVLVPWQYAKYDPTDVVTVSLSDGASVVTRLVEMNVGADLKIDFSTVGEQAATYTPGVVEADGGDGFEPQVVTGPTTSKLMLLDSPLLRDIDDPGQTYTLLYYAAGGYVANWPGLELYRSSDGGAYADVGGVASSASWGSCTNTLGDTDTPFGVDSVNTLTVIMTQGGDNLASATLEEVCNGANAAIVYNPSNGVLEIIQFQTVTLNGDGSYTLSDLVRGRRGTEVYTGTHAAGEVFILLTDGSGTVDEGVATVGMSLGDLNVLRFFKGVTQGTLLENAAVVEITDTGRALKPYAPVSQTATIDGSDIDLAWERRTRVGGQWLDGTGSVPLSETSEAYEVDIYDGTGTTVLRTLTSSTTSVTYADADITTDFGSIPSTLTIAVYQMSAQIGRGFTKKVTIDVE
ncbi:hypothetical protein GC176_20560 [bacterium]|nr:hypothetical protein [bacterium]